MQKTAGYRCLRHYTFVDYATQAYMALVAVLVLCFHNGTVARWTWIVGANVAAIILVHGLIQWQARRVDNKVLFFLRHFYPVLLYTWFFTETGSINRMFFKDYMDPLAIGWDQAPVPTAPRWLA